MALFEDVFKGAGIPGLAIGIGAALLAPTVLPIVGRAVRPVAKAAIKTGITVYRETTRQVASAAAPVVEEVRKELATKT